MRLGFEGMVNVDCAGRSGGLAFLWKKADEFSLLGFSQNPTMENNGFLRSPRPKPKKHNVRSAMVCNW